MNLNKSMFKGLSIVMGLVLVLVFSAMPLTAQATPEVLFSDNFDNADGTAIPAHNSAWTVAGGSPVIQNNTLHADVGDYSFLTLPGITTGDQCASYDALFPVVGGGVYLNVRSSADGQSTYYAFLNVDGLGLAWISPSQQQYLATVGGVTPESGWHNFKLCAIGNQISAYLDNVVLASVTDNQYSQGSTALFAAGGMDVDNFLYEGESQQQLVALNPAQVWVGLKNSDSVGVKFDLRAEAYANGTLVSSGQLNSVHAGSSGFNNAKLNTIPFDAFTPLDFPAGSSLSIKVLVRNACTGSGHNSGVARLWHNDSAANSQFGATIGTNTSNLFLRDGFVLATSAGAGPKKTIDVQSGAKCSPFKPFGTWTIVP